MILLVKKLTNKTREIKLQKNSITTSVDGEWASEREKPLESILCLCCAERILRGSDFTDKACNYHVSLDSHISNQILFLTKNHHH